MINKIVLLGYGTIGKCVFDLLVLDHKYIHDHLGLDVLQNPLFVIDKHLPPEKPFSHLKNLFWIETKLEKNSLYDIFHSIDLKKGDLVIDLTSCTETRQIVKMVACRFHACYICTAIEGWGGWIYPMPQMVSNVATLIDLLPNDGNHPSVLLTHGMNPGMVSHFAILATKLLHAHDRKDVKTLHITEIDTQVILSSKERTKEMTRNNLSVAVPNLIKRRSGISKDIISTWGPQNFVDEMNTPPIYVSKGRTVKGRKKSLLSPIASFIYDPLTQRMISYQGYNVTHEETFTINNYLKKTFDAKSDIAFVYKPTDVSYRTLLSNSGVHVSSKKRKGLLLKGPNVVGYDTVGIYLETHSGKRIWVGNACKTGYAANNDIKRRYHNATTMQVAAGVMAALYVISKRPNLGLRYPEDIPDNLRQGLLSFAERYFGEIIIIKGT